MKNGSVTASVPMFPSVVENSYDPLFVIPLEYRWRDPIVKVIRIISPPVCRVKGEGKAQRTGCPSIRVPEILLFRLITVYSFLLKRRLSQLFFFSGSGGLVDGKLLLGGAAIGVEAPISPPPPPNGIGLLSPCGGCTGPPP